MGATDYYQTLGVSKNADDAEIKKGACAALECVLARVTSCRSSRSALVEHVVHILAAYRKLAMKWHPVSSLTCSFLPRNAAAALRSLACTADRQYSGFVHTANAGQEP